MPKRLTDILVDNSTRILKELSETDVTEYLLMLKDIIQILT